MKKVLVAAMVTAALTGCGYFYFQSQSVAAEQPSARSAREIPVTLGQVSAHSVAQSLSLVGKLEAQRSVNIATQVAARVEQIAIGVNSKVEKGELLVQLDDAKPKAAYAEAQAYLNDEKRKYNEYQKLVSRGAITQTELDAQLASVNIADARLQAAKADLADHAIRAPFSGTVGLVDFSEGHMLTVGSELFSLDDLSLMRLDIQVPEQYLSFLREGMTVEATSQAWPGRAFSGQIKAIDSRVQADSLNIRVRVVFDNPEALLKPGMLMAAKIGFAPQDAAVIPVQALEYSGTKRFVYLVDETGKAHRTEVKLGVRVENEVVIESGVGIGDRIVVQGLVNMRDGVQVNDIMAQRNQNAPKQQVPTGDDA
ncbi:efflux RND transporter periplasmic adaptor subunit [Photobacterium sp. DA100]|uniref:efflux RND transporter periplasmic adaptor subunit n=1 Tax=Photobacterium sp. DA100 TaxID=3027472 RepID=UPI0024791268|nr:efflux RND transporter periplasmic adaptor subunit [Photobacterium sp. DA100]WEM43034.1 efflux RND transporter periplasmic adaptor subunit [Photobacterium sp. DA100]